MTIDALSAVSFTCFSVAHAGGCPPDYGPYTTIYNRFNRWAKRGHWKAIFEALARCGKDGVSLSIDSTTIKAHRSASGGKGGSMNRRSAARAVGGPRKSTR
jgi:transposase